MTNETDHFAEYEEQFYKERITEADKWNMQYQNQFRISTIINNSIIEKDSKDKDMKFQLKLKEYDNFKKLLRCFINKNFSRISYVYGGYKAVHDLCIKSGITLIDHDPGCFFCCAGQNQLDKQSLVSSFISGSNNKPSPSKIPKKYESNDRIQSIQANQVTQIKDVPSSSSKSTFSSLFSKVNPLNWIRKSNNTLSPILSKPAELKKSHSMSANEKTQSTTLSDANRKITEHLAQNLSNDQLSINSVLSVVQISKLITSKNHLTFTCTFVEYKNKVDFILKPQSHLIALMNIDSQSIFFFNFISEDDAKSLGHNDEKKIQDSTETKEANQSNYNLAFNLESNENLYFFLFETISLGSILNIFTKKGSRNIVTLNYKQQNQKIEQKVFQDMVLDFITDSDSKSFIQAIKKVVGTSK